MLAPLGDDVFKDDPTVNLLERRVMKTAASKPASRDWRAFSLVDC